MTNIAVKSAREIGLHGPFSGLLTNHTRIMMKKNKAIKKVPTPIPKIRVGLASVVSSSVVVMVYRVMI